MLTTLWGSTIFGFSDFRPGQEAVVDIGVGRMPERGVRVEHEHPILMLVRLEPHAVGPRRYLVPVEPNILGEADLGRLIGARRPQVAPGDLASEDDLSPANGWTRAPAMEVTLTTAPCAAFSSSIRPRASTTDAKKFTWNT